MNKEFKSMFDTDNINDLIKNVSKYNLVAIPVTDHEMKLLRQCYNKRYYL